jgi:hypothetical protein
MCLTDFIDWRYIHSWLVIFDTACELLPHGRRTPNPKCLSLLVFNSQSCWYFDPSCELSPLYLLSDLPHPSPLPKVNRTVNTDSVWLWGWGVLSFVVDHILQKFNTLFLTRFRA